MYLWGGDFMKGKYNAQNIAEWFLNKNRVQMNFEDSEYITNLKLQKLLYYAQGYYLAKKIHLYFKMTFCLGNMDQ